MPIRSIKHYEPGEKVGGWVARLFANPITPASPQTNETGVESSTQPAADVPPDELDGPANV